MANVNFTIADQQYDTMMLVLDGIRSKLGANREVLARILSQENGREKIVAFVQSPAGKWLREVKRARDDLNEFFDRVGWRDD